jgi:hypothetical protein
MIDGTVRTSLVDGHAQPATRHYERDRTEDQERCRYRRDVNEARRLQIG